MKTYSLTLQVPDEANIDLVIRAFCHAAEQLDTTLMDELDVDEQDEQDFLIAGLEVKACLFRSE